MVTAAEVRAIVEEVLKSQGQQASVPWLLLVLMAFVAGTASLVGSYLSTKGRNLATSEDIDKLTRAAEEIKARVSGDLWLRQTKWTFKQKLYVSLLESLAHLRSGYRRMEVLLERFDPSNQEYMSAYEANVKEIVEDLKEHRKAFTKAKAPCSIILNAAALAALEDLQVKESNPMPETGAWEYLQERVRIWEEAHRAVTEAAKLDLQLG